MKGKNKRVVGALALLAMLAGCASEEEAVQMAPLPVVESEFTPNQLWSTQVGSGLGQYFTQLTPTYRYGKIFAADRDGVIKALSPDTGKVIWETDVEEDKPARLSGGITAAYNRIFIGTENADLIALDEETGELLWRAKTQGEVLSRPLAESTLVVVNTSRGILEAFDATTGESRWQIGTEVPNLTLRGDSSPVSVGGGIFWGMSNGRLGAALAEAGQMLWQQPIASPKGATEIDRLVDVDATPVIVGDRLYAVGFNGELVSIELQTGQPAWKRAYSSSKDFAIQGQRLFLVTDQDHVVAVDTRSGTELWRNSSLEYRLLTPPAVIDNHVVVTDSEGYMHWLDTRNGEFSAQQMVSSSGVAHAPIEVGASYLFMTRDGQVKRMQLP
ncbi:outer membrane protein assembly factor BamB [Thaumasiovibrio subtropicus]|uniref:outer membrane protein assembly factor BamB n=1 Tax=Thaumasiovibrio subtropicus TaxID=1891207 RepID=UPI000B35AD7A|nr:outer membrane protein assembly factor BamB [Thaumasiovibrio subtropicus]